MNIYLIFLNVFFTAQSKDVCIANKQGLIIYTHHPLNANKVTNEFKKEILVDTQIINCNLCDCTLFLNKIDDFEAGIGKHNDTATNTKKDKEKLNDITKAGKTKNKNVSDVQPHENIRYIEEDLSLEPEQKIITADETGNKITPQDLLKPNNIKAYTSSVKSQNNISLLGTAYTSKEIIEATRERNYLHENTEKTDTASSEKAKDSDKHLAVFKIANLIVSYTDSIKLNDLYKLVPENKHFEMPPHRLDNEFQTPTFLFIYEEYLSYYDEYMNLLRRKFPLIKCAKIHKKEIKSTFIGTKLNLSRIQHYPILTGVRQDNVHIFSKAWTYENLVQFGKVLGEEALIKLEDISILDNKVFYILFTKNNNTGYFERFAINYKFIVKFYHSTDSELMRKLDIHIKGDAVLVLNRHGVLHTLQIRDVNKGYDAVKKWIEHSYWPNVVQLNGENLYRVLKGYKPIVLLIDDGNSESNNREYTNRSKYNQKFYETYLSRKQGTYANYVKNDDLLTQFEHVSETIHSDQPYYDFTFAYVDEKILPRFADSLVPNTQLPCLLINLPNRQVFLSQKKYTGLKEISLDIFNKLFYDYENNKLDTFPNINKGQIFRDFFIAMFWVLGIFGLASLLIATVVFKSRIVYWVRCMLK